MEGREEVRRWREDKESKPHTRNRTKYMTLKADNKREAWERKTKEDGL